MSRPPVVAIVGRPNVGKSSLFNRLAGRRIAIVDRQSGVTRDRVSVLVEAEGGVYELIDTGGMGGPNPDDLGREVEAQIDLALAQADLIVFLADGREGPTAADREVSARLRPLAKPVLLAVNKLDRPEMQSVLPEFFTLGWGEPWPLSVHQARGTAELRQAIAERLTLAPAGALPAPELLLALIGKRNAGKSTLLNTLAGERRVVVSDRPGTTRDSVDVRVNRPGQPPFVVIDTAGQRQARSVRDPVEFYSLKRTDRAIRRCHVALLLLDATVPVSRVDKQLADAVAVSGKAAAIAVNKWDAADPADPEAYARYLGESLPGSGRWPLTFLSARDGTNVQATLKLVRSLFAQSGRKVNTAAVNQALAAAVARQGPPAAGGRQPRLFYGTQVGVHPPAFLIFASHPNKIGRNYRRYLEHALGDQLGFPEVPLKISFRSKEAAGGRPGAARPPRAPRGRAKKPRPGKKR